MRSYRLKTSVLSRRGLVNGYAHWLMRDGPIDIKTPLFRGVLMMQSKLVLLTGGFDDCFEGLRLVYCQLS
jgi:hypothetical protein